MKTKVKKNFIHDPDTKKKVKKNNATHLHAARGSLDSSAQAMPDMTDSPATRRAFNQRHEISIAPEGECHSCTALATAPFPPAVLKLLLSQPGFSEPTGVQCGGLFC